MSMLLDTDIAHRVEVLSVANGTARRWRQRVELQGRAAAVRRRPGSGAQSHPVRAAGLQAAAYPAPRRRGLVPRHDSLRRALHGHGRPARGKQLYLPHLLEAFSPARLPLLSRQGLPVLTLLGEAFPSRVAASLYASFSHHAQCNGAAAELSECLLADTMVADSAKEFVDTATRIARLVIAQRQRQHSQAEGNPPSSQVLGQAAVLQEAIEGGKGFFNATRNVELFVRGMQVLEDAKDAAAAFAGSPAAHRFHTVLL